MRLIDRTAVVTGITGQDGSYLTELLLEKGYRVIGHVRPGPTACPGHTSYLGQSWHLKDRVEIVSFPEHSQEDWDRLIGDLKPDEVYHLAASSSVRESWNQPKAVLHSNIGFPLVLLEAIRTHSSETRAMFASSSEVFGSPLQSPQSETTPYAPCTPYGVTKAATSMLVQTYRNRYGLYLCHAILFNHESPRRSEAFLSRKVTSTAAKIKLGLADRLELGDLSITRDWGFAGDFVRAMWGMLQLDKAEDFVIGTGTANRASRFVDIAFRALNLPPEPYVKIQESLFRPNDPSALVADISKARKMLGWTPKVSFEQLVEMMVQADMDSLQRIQHNTAAA